MSSLGSLPSNPFGTASGWMPAGGGAVPMLPVADGSDSGTGGTLAVVSDFDLKTSPSLVEVSQPLSHSRLATVAIRTRPALPPIGVSPGDQAVGSARRGESTHATLRYRHNEKPAAPS